MDKLSTKKPFLLYVLIILFIIGGAVSLVGTIGVFQAWIWWLVYSSIVPVIFHVFTGILVTLIWGSAAVVLWLRRPWAIIYAGISVTIISIWFWIERIFLTKNPLPFSRHIFLLVISCIFLLFVFSSLYLVAPSMKPSLSTQKLGGNNFNQTKGEKNEQTTTRN